MADYTGENRLLKIAEVADLLRVSRTQAYRLMSMGQLQYVRFGEQTLRVRAGDLDQYILDHVEKGSSVSRKNVISGAQTGAVSHLHGRGE